MIDEGVKSIHELEPLEGGGTAARQGFLFQDHVAAGFCLEMLLSGGLRAVWCETLDDVTLIWEVAYGEVVEFVQVKAEHLEQLWSPALLYAREGRKGNKKVGSSVLEKLLANDRCREPCQFRLVTRRPAAEELRVLEAPLGAEVRNPGSDTMQSLLKKLEENLGDAESPNGHGPRWWAQHTVLQAGHSDKSIQNQNLRLLGQAVDASGRFLASDQREQLYDLLLMKVKAAADADKSLSRDAGKLSSAALADWFSQQVQLLEQGGSKTGGRALREKLEAAGIPEDTVVAFQAQ